MSTRLAQQLIGEGLVTPAVVDEALQRQVVYGGSLDTNLLELGAIDEEGMLGAMGRCYTLPVADRAHIDHIAGHIPRIFPLPFAETYHIVPAGLRGQTLDVMVNGAPDEQLFEKIFERLQLNVEPQVTTEVRMHYAMNRLYGTQLLPRYVSLLARLEGATLEELQSRVVQGDRILSWGVSGSYIAPSRTRGDKQKAGLDVRGLLSRVDAATDRDTIVEVLLGATLAVFEFGGLFLVHNETVHGWRGTDPASTQRIARITLSLTLPSVFQTIFATRGHYLGPLPNNSANAKLLADLGRAPPRAAFVVPVLVAGHLAAILYADNGSKSISPKRVAAMLVLAQRVSVALERLVRRRKTVAHKSMQPPVEGEEVAIDVELIDEVEHIELGEAEFEQISEEVLANMPKAAPGGTAAPAARIVPPQSDALSDAAVLESAAVDAAQEGWQSVDGEVVTDSATVGTDEEETESWESVSFGEIDTSPAASTAAFAEGAVTHADADDVYVAFSDVDESEEGSLDDWQDVLGDTAEAAAASATLEAKPTASRPATRALSWEEVIAEAERAAQFVPKPADKVVEVAGTTLDADELWFDGLDAAEPQTRRDAVHALLERGDSIDPVLLSRFPGRIDFDALDPASRLPALQRCSGLLELLAARGAAAYRIVLPQLSSDEPLRRVFAVYFLVHFPHPPAIGELARRLYDSEPRVRDLAADALRRCSREPAYKQVVENVRAQLRVPSLDNQVFAAQLLGQLRDPGAVPLLIPMLAAGQPELVTAVGSALAVICAQDFGASVEPWAAWWRAHYSLPRPAWLIEALRDERAELRRLANSELQALTGRTANFDADAESKSREQAVRLWEAWWAQVTSQAAAAAPSSAAS